MAKKTAIASAIEVTYKSVTDLGYSVAKKSDAAKLDGKYAVENIAGFPDSISKEQRDEFYCGARLRASELPQYQPVEYCVVDNNYIPADQLSGEKPIERYIVSVASVFSYTAQEFGAMKSNNPQFYAIVQDLRTRVNVYCSNALGELKNSARKYLKEKNPETKTRAANLAYIAFLEKEFDTFKTRCKTAEARGNDPTADSNKLARATAAFWKEYDVK